MIVKLRLMYSYNLQYFKNISIILKNLNNFTYFCLFSNIFAIFSYFLKLFADIIYI